MLSEYKTRRLFLFMGIDCRAGNFRFDAIVPPQLCIVLPHVDSRLHGLKRDAHGESGQAISTNSISIGWCFAQVSFNRLSSLRRRSQPSKVESPCRRGTRNTAGEMSQYRAPSITNRRALSGESMILTISPSHRSRLVPAAAAQVCVTAEAPIAHMLQHRHAVHGHLHLPSDLWGEGRGRGRVEPLCAHHRNTLQTGRSCRFSISGASDQSPIVLPALGRSRRCHWLRSPDICCLERRRAIGKRPR